MAIRRLKEILRRGIEVRALPDEEESKADVEKTLRLAEQRLIRLEAEISLARQRRPGRAS